EGNVEEIKTDITIVEDNLTDLIEAGRIIQSDEEPETAEEGQMWIDTSQDPNRFNIYLNGEWEFIGDDLEEVYENISNLGDDLGDLAEDLFEYQTDTEASIERNQAELEILSDE